VSDVDALEQICVGGVVPVVVINDPASAQPLGEALIAGGLPVAEVTLRTASALEAMHTLASNPALLVGAGTVIRAAQVDLAVEAGARFVVTPGFSATVVDRCRKLGVPIVPGISTPTDIIAALEYGIDLLKFFPAEPAGGVAMLRALSAPFPEVRFIPTGGVSSANIATYLAVKSVVAVGGSWMVAPELISSGDFEGIARLSAEAVQLAAEAHA
jgi:2-dehydro-3-deoxyphosphogluconate aldolase / (4S)-4-hydroxy-2-oxoglutarate aldolase